MKTNEIIPALQAVILASPYPGAELHVRCVAQETNALNTYFMAQHLGEYGFGQTAEEAYQELAKKLGDPKQRALKKAQEARKLLDEAQKIAPNHAVEEALYHLP